MCHPADSPELAQGLLEDLPMDLAPFDTFLETIQAWLAGARDEEVQALRILVNAELVRRKWAPEAEAPFRSQMRPQGK